MDQNRFKDKYGPWALVTGASSGIGLEFARQIAALGLNVILVARRKDRLVQLAAELEKAHGVETRVHPSDLSKDDFLQDLQTAVKGLEVGLLINNAGFGTTGTFVDNDLEKEIQLLHVNCRAALILAHTYGRAMKGRRKGGMIFVSSVVGFTAVPLWSNYAASKAYDLLLSEALGDELKPYGVDVLALCPGTTEAEFGQVAQTKQFMPMPVHRVVRLGLKALGRKTKAVPGIFNRFNVVLIQILPRRWSRSAFGRAIQYLQKPPKKD